MHQFMVNWYGTRPLSFRTLTLETQVEYIYIEANNPPKHKVTQHFGTYLKLVIL